MKRQQGNIALAQRELLITMDYLINHTDETHPATQLAVCRYAKEEYGIPFCEGKLRGNGIRRERIGTTLKYLEKLTDKYPEVFPFVLERTDGGKYYVESKFSFTERDIIGMASAIKDDPYTSEEDSGYLLSRFLDSVADPYKRPAYEKVAAERSLSHKFSELTLRKLKLLQKAHDEHKLVTLEETTRNGKGVHFLVYGAKECAHEPYAILLPVNGGPLRFEKISLLPLARTLLPDHIPDRDVPLFVKTKGLLPDGYSSVERYVLDVLMPSVDGVSLDNAIEILFLARREALGALLESYESCFGASFHYEELSEEEPYPFVRGYLCSAKLSGKAFVQWAASLGRLASSLEVKSPSNIKEELGVYYHEMSFRYEEGR